MNMGNTSLLFTTSLALALFIQSAGAAQVEAVAAAKKKPASPAQLQKAHSGATKAASSKKAANQEAATVAAPASASDPAAKAQAPKTPPAAGAVATIQPTSTATATTGGHGNTIHSGVHGGRAISVVAANADLLREAYHLLSLADHDYKGHRIRAMHQISAAAKLVGASLHHDGHGGENQLTSDEQLHEAQALVQRALSFYGGSPKVLEHLKAANKHLSVALSIR